MNDFEIKCSKDIKSHQLKVIGDIPTVKIKLNVYFRKLQEKAKNL